MRTIVLDWKKTNVLDMDSMENTYWYMLTYRGKIRYVGITSPASNQSVQDEIRSKKHIEKFDAIYNHCIIWLGYFKDNTKYQDSICRCTNKIVHETENLLIYKTNPDLNDYCKCEYRGRDFRIINKGCELLPKKICEYNKRKRNPIALKVRKIRAEK